MKKYLILLSLIGLAGCKPENVTIDQVISGLKISNTAPLADGTTIIYLSATLNNQADPGKTSVIFTTSAGHLLTSATVDSTVTQPAVFQADGSLVATVGLRVPITTGKITVKAQPSSPTLKPYILTSTITTQPSLPAKLILTPSALSVKTGFGGEIQLSAVLKNSVNNNVSTGMKVVFSDYYANGQPVSGLFRALKDTTDITSSVSTAYTPGYISPTTQFYIKCTYIDASGKATAISDACLITVTP